MDHGSHGSMDMSCPMDMAWNWDTTNLCILSSSWRISTLSGLYISLALITTIAVVYEWLRLYIRRLDAQIAHSVMGASKGSHRRKASILPTSLQHASSGDSAGLARVRASSPSRSIASTNSNSSNWSKKLGIARSLPISQRAQARRSFLYALSVLISFVLMLIAMTFNGYIIGAIVIGTCHTTSVSTCALTLIFFLALTQVRDWAITGLIETCLPSWTRIKASPATDKFYTEARRTMRLNCFTS